MTPRVTVVTGTDTEVGKTVATAALAAAHRAAARSVAMVKPIQTGLAPGAPGDAAEVGRLAGVEAYELVRLPEPLAPEAAAARSGAQLPTVEDLAAGCLDVAGGPDVLLVEGAGGALVRLDAAGGTILDLARALEWEDVPAEAVDVVVVVRAGLGTLNHTELTVHAVRRAGLRVAGLVVGSWPAEPDLAARSNAEDLPRLTGLPLLGRLPAGAAALDPADFRKAAPGWLAGWPTG